MFSNAEYSKNYLNLPTEVRRGKAAPQELKIGGAFYGSTENTDAYRLHAMPPRFQIVKAKYIKNEAKLESETTQSANFKAHAVSVPPRRAAPKFVKSKDLFEGTMLLTQVNIGDNQGVARLT